MEKKAIYLLCVLIICSLICILPVTADTTPPSVISTDPANGATGVLGNPTIIVTFDKWISDDSSHPLTGSITINDGTNNIDFDYAYAFATELHFGNSTGPWLAHNTVYTVTIEGFEDLAGNPMTSPYSWTFTTGDDTSPPTVVSTYPAMDEMRIPLDIDAITLQFNEPIQWDPDSPYMNVKLFSAVGWVEVPIGSVSVGGDLLDTLIISNPGTPDPWLEYWVYNIDPVPDTGLYSVQVSGIKDVAGNEMVPSNHYWYFYTVPLDTTPPSVISTYPVNGDYNVPLDGTITATFDQSINRCLGSVELKDHNGNLVESSETWDAPDYIHLTFQPTNLLLDGETYTVTLQGLIDSYHNVMPDYSWSFSTPTPVSTPEFPSVFLPATMIIGFFGAVLLIQRTREH